MECREDLVEEAIELIREALRSYLASNCSKLLSLARTAGQRLLRVELYGLFRYYSPSENFPRFMNALKYLSQCSSMDRLRQEVGYEDLEVSQVDERLSRMVFRVDDLEALCTALQS